MRLYLIALVLILSGAAISPASAAPATPRFGSTIDDYADYDGQDTCDPAPKPGVVAFRDLLQQTYGKHTWGIARSCQTAGVSEHEEGRALDYHFNYNDTAQRADADDVLTWLLAKDEHGNSHAMARRLGLMYIIWNRQIWESYRPQDGWQRYDGSNPHTDHIHFSFSWAGALAQTSWWTGEQFSPMPLARLADFDGDGRLDVATFTDSGLSISRNVSNVGAPAREPAQAIAGDWAAVSQPEVVDFDGDSRADIIARQSDSVLVWLGAAPLTFAPPVTLSVTGDYLNPADVDGDGKPDLVSFTEDGDTALLWLNSSTAGKPSIMDYRHVGTGFSSAQHLTLTDWDFDRRADILGRQGDAVQVWLSTAAGFATAAAIGTTSSTHMLDPADLDGDGKPDLGVVGVAAQRFDFMHNTSAPGLPSMSAAEPVVGGWTTQEQLMTGDFDGDRRADVIGRQGGVLQIWLSGSTSTQFSFNPYATLTRLPTKEPLGDWPAQCGGGPVAGGHMVTVTDGSWICSSASAETVRWLGFDDVRDEDELGRADCAGDLPAPWGGKVDAGRLEADVAVAIWHEGADRWGRAVEALANDLQLPAGDSVPAEFVAQVAIGLGLELQDAACAERTDPEIGVALRGTPAEERTRWHRWIGSHDRLGHRAVALRSGRYDRRSRGGRRGGGERSRLVGGSVARGGRGGHHRDHGKAEHM